MIDIKGKKIFLGMCMNQAVELLKTVPCDLEKLDDYEGLYKNTVRTIYKWNSELEQEIVGGGTASNSSADETKPCPKCGVDIPVFYRYHPSCGWKQE